MIFIWFIFSLQTFILYLIFSYYLLFIILFIAELEAYSKTGETPEMEIFVLTVLNGWQFLQRVPSCLLCSDYVFVKVSLM